MSSKVHCYLYTLRREWGLTQEELASLLPRGGRNRVSCVERNKHSPNAEEILAYWVIFGSLGYEVFTGFYGKLEDTVMQAAYRFHEQLEGDTSEKAERKRELIRRMFERTTGNANLTAI
ncbi:MAG: hypothetical protein P4L72_15805 [Parvibaculum sp.]|uniref:hypothetical protein n=1 Tax=Parvibaculum sp. TaxID=2024848 RepID=UPI002849E53D|nr:hypothetical protein [Parvibaculum sp.]MDR3500679.1 hypothetical protein [Parvibaculum sp.]